MKLLVVTLMMLTLSACADLSMYNQVPAPIGRSGEAMPYPSQPFPEQTQTYPMDEPAVQGEVGYGAVAPSAPSLSNQNPAVVALLDSAYQQKESGQLDVAASKLERAVRIAPRDASVWAALASVRFEQKKYALAISLAKKSNLLSMGNGNLQYRNWLLIADSHDALGHASPAHEARVKARDIFR